MSSAVCSLRLKVSASEIMASAVQTAPVQSNRLYFNPPGSDRIQPWYPEQQQQRSGHICAFRRSLSLKHLCINYRNIMKGFAPLHRHLGEKLFFVLTLKLRLSLEHRNKLVWLNLIFWHKLTSRSQETSGDAGDAVRTASISFHLSAELIRIFEIIARSGLLRGGCAFRPITRFDSDLWSYLSHLWKGSINILQVSYL